MLSFFDLELGGPGLSSHKIMIQWYNNKLY